MRSGQFFFAVVLFFAPGQNGSPCCSGDQQLPEGWAASCVSVKELDFGITIRGLEPTRSFKITNHGKAPLHIAGITLSAGPFSIREYPEKPIRPGETGIVDVIMDTLQHRGAKRQMITITLDLPGYSQIRLPAKGYVREDITCDTSPDGPGVLKLVGTSKRTAKIAAYAKNKGWKVPVAESSLSDLEVSIREIGRKPNNGGTTSDIEYEVSVAAKAADGRIDASIKIRLNDKDLPSFEIPVVREAAPAKRGAR